MSCWHWHVLFTKKTSRTADTDYIPKICHEFFDDLRWKRSLDGQVISIKFSMISMVSMGGSMVFYGSSPGFRIGFSDRHQIHGDPPGLSRQGEGPGDVELSRGRSNWGEPTHLEGPRVLSGSEDFQMGMVSKPEKNSDYIIILIMIVIIMIVITITI